jgi:UDP-N-acetylmuramoyl-L-alanyl-D-glutamate--2,6-diaminopimelate ligase
MTAAGIYRVACHTDNVGPGSTFVAITGYKYDGADYVAVAIAKGATTIVVQQDHTRLRALEQEVQRADVRLQVVPDARLALAHLAAHAYGYPANKLKLIGITGTKGKTTTSWLTAHILQKVGIKTALLSSAGNKIEQHSYPASLTTAQPDYLHWFFAQCVEQGVAIVVVEVAAQALSLHRVAGLSFDAVAYTNFGQEHGEFYPTMDDYFAAKEQLLTLRKPGAPAYISSDEPALQPLFSRHKNCVSIGGRIHAEKGIEVVSSASTSAGVALTIRPFSQQPAHGLLPNLLGSFNGMNAAFALALAHTFGVRFEHGMQALTCFESVPGRMVIYTLPRGITGIIDHAHNPSSYQALLSTLRNHFTQITVVFGCAGEKARDKRPVMGAIAAQLADVVILTTDNPRSENPETIVEEIQAGITAAMPAEVFVEPDREKAIRLAYSKARPGGVIALLGKSLDHYQLVAGKKIPWNETDVLQKIAAEEA